MSEAAANSPGVGAVCHGNQLFRARGRVGGRQDGTQCLDGEVVMVQMLHDDLFDLGRLSPIGPETAGDGGHQGRDVREGRGGDGARIGES